MGMRHRVIAATLGILVASTAGAAVFLQAVVPNLVLYLPFDEGSGTLANDQSGNNLDGALQTGTQFSTTVPAVPTGNPASLEIPNAATSPGRVVVNHDPSLAITGAFTLAAWIRPTANTANQMGIIEKWDYPSSINGYFLRLHRAAGPPVYHYAGFSVGSGTGQYGIGEYNTAVPLNQWTHLAAVYDGNGGMTLYRNGNPVATGTAPVGQRPGASTAPLHVGSDYGGNRFQGQLDEVRVFNIALSAPQIGVLVNGMAAPTLTSLVSPAGFTLVVTWTSVPGATSYTILRGTAAGALSPLATVGPLETSYTDTTVAYPTRYYYAVVANGIMSSGRSNELNEVPIPDLPRFNDHEEGFKDRNCGCGTAAAPGSGLAALAVSAALAWLLARRAA
jgi:uncharacterized protein (TIGR03382 family)